MSLRPDNPLIVQSDRSLMLHTVRALVDAKGKPKKDADGSPMTEEHPRFAEARDALAPFAELEKSPDYLHTYRITPVSVWNAAALGFTAERIAEVLEEFACVPVPRNVMTDVAEWVSRYGLLRIERRPARNDQEDAAFELLSDTDGALADVLGHEQVARLVERDDEGRALGRRPVARLDQAGADQDRLPRRRPRRLPRRRPAAGAAARDHAGRQPVRPAALPAGGRRGLPRRRQRARRQRRGRAALRRGQDRGRPDRHEPGGGPRR